MSEIYEKCIRYTFDMPRIHIQDGQTLIWIKCDWVTEWLSEWDTDEMKTRDAYASKNLLKVYWKLIGFEDWRSRDTPCHTS